MLHQQIDIQEKQMKKPIVQQSQIQEALQQEMESTQLALQQEVGKRRKAERQILQISEREQRRIGHELHDGVVHDLTALSLAGDLLYKEIRKEEPEIAEKLKGFIHIVDQSNTKLRNLARGLSPVHIHEVGLVGAVEQLANQMQSWYGVSCVCEMEEDMAVDNPETAHHIYRIIQEAFNNAIKHSGSLQVLIRAYLQNDCLHFVIKDYGTGFNTETGGYGGMGIYIMKYRAALMESNLYIKSEPAIGTEVRFAVPETKCV